jgi:hypothetical protein
MNHFVIRGNSLRLFSAYMSCLNAQGYFIPNKIIMVKTATVC